MFQKNRKYVEEKSRYSLLVIFSFGLHAAVVLGLPEGEAKTLAKAPPVRVQARLVSPPPPKPVTIEAPKLELKPKPIKKTTARKGRKKRRAARTLVAKVDKVAPSENAPIAVVNPEPDKLGSVTDLGDWDPDATDEELDREYDKNAVEAPKLEPAKKKNLIADRKATCMKCTKPAFPEDSTTVLPTRVVLSVKVRANGTVEKVTVVSGVDPLLDEAAKKALLASLFVPAIRNGKTVSDRIPFTVEFK